MLAILQIGDGTRRPVPIEGNYEETVTKVKAMLNVPWLELTVHHGTAGEYIRTSSIVSFEVRPR